jgi:hypothetical protein
MARDTTAATGSAGLTVGQLVSWLAGEEVSDGLLDWAPDVAALTTVLLKQSHAFRFVVSPPSGAAWPPPQHPAYAATVAETATRWRALMDGDDGGAPELVERLWAVVLEHIDTPLAELSCGKPWSLCEAVLMLHSIADEAAAGCAGAAIRRSADGSPGADGAVHLARAHELLAQRGSLARLPVDRVRHLPKSRTSAVGMTHRSLSRYAATTTGDIPAVWHRAPLRRFGPDLTSRHANLLLLPWPLRLRETDFEPVPGSVRRPEREPFGFFRYTPSEPLDLELVDQLIAAALDEVDAVDAVVLPEGRLHESEVVAFEAVLAKRGVSLLLTGLRIDPAAPGELPRNGLHLSVLVGQEWWHYRQNKHHRWFLDAGQVEQYNIAGALHPSVRWWEEMQVPERSVHVLELGGGLTVAAVVCEDLARQDGVAELLREIAPSLVVTLLLDGPQLASRWTARYAGVLADDPGSSVLTLTAYGMASRSRPHGMPPSGVISMWKDPSRGLREITLENGAQGVLVKTSQGPAPRYVADSRLPADDATDLYVTGIHQVRGDPRRPLAAKAAEAGEATEDAAGPSDIEPNEPTLDTDELSVLFSWAEAVARAASGDESERRVEHVLEQLRPGAVWRARMGLPEPPPRLEAALEALSRLTRASADRCEVLDVDALLTALGRNGGDQVERLVHRVLRTTLDAAR